MLKVTNVTKTFGTFTAVDHVSFLLKEGEILGLLGRNGAGKTTTIQMLLGIMTPTSGTIAYFGKEFFSHREEILQQINFSSTYISMPWFFTVGEILELYAMLYQVSDRKKRINKLLGEFELDALVKKQFYMLSAGEKTRLLITKSFLNYPKLILLDEPTASLDPEIAIKIREFLKKEKKEYNVSMLFTSHNMSEVEEMCDRVMIIRSGKIIAEDVPENLAKKIQTSSVELLIPKNIEQTEGFLKKEQITFERENHRFIISIAEHNIAELLIKLTKDNIVYQEISINKPTLEDYFLEVIKE